MITLENRERRMRTYNLERSEHRKTLKFIQAGVGKRGEVVLTRKVKSIGDSITFAARGTSGAVISQLPESILQCQDIAAAIARGNLRKVK